MARRRGRPTGYKLSKKSKAKISSTKTGQRHSKETKASIAAGVTAYWQKKRIKPMNVFDEFTDIVESFGIDLAPGGDVFPKEATLDVDQAMKSTDTRNYTSPFKGHAYVRKCLNDNCLPVFKWIIEYGVEDFSRDQLEQLIERCKKALTYYDHKRGFYHDWTYCLEQLREGVVRQAENTWAKRMAAIIKLLSKPGAINANELYWLSVECGNYTHRLTAKDTVEHYTWAGVEAKILEMIIARKLNLTERLKTSECKVYDLKYKIKEQEVEAIKFRSNLSALEGIGGAYKHETTLVKSDGSCDGCKYNGDLEGCKTRVDHCKSGEYIFT